jgi:tRNA (uracil-5-)-methyltransferase TRM9
MDQETCRSLLEINRKFYREFGAAFASTRRRIQPGVRRILASLPEHGHLLDLGCGSGTLAAEWAKTHTGSYSGLDFSPVLLEEAHHAVKGLLRKWVEITFQQADLSAPDWVEGLQVGGYDTVMAFAVFHHLPGIQQRLEILKKVRTLLKPTGRFIHSEWQFQHSAKWMARRVAWDSAGVDQVQLEEGDTILDWRHVLPGEADRVGLRYVHLFNEDELTSLAKHSGFKVVEQFESDGENGRLGLYQVWVGTD